MKHVALPVLNNSGGVIGYGVFKAYQVGELGSVRQRSCSAPGDELPLWQLNKPYRLVEFHDKPVHAERGAARLTARLVNV